MEPHRGRRSSAPMHRTEHLLATAGATSHDLATPIADEREAVVRLKSGLEPAS
ncbi:hypothetical protein ACIBL3_14470 [Kribbella sp. NPDC050124]|uniref:hypothetical protein n=1 Tax=Kribbella sp. NPDC050124 TaxID=3364114 RepID=UPI0037927E7C